MSKIIFDIRRTSEVATTMTNMAGVSNEITASEDNSSIDTAVEGTMTESVDSEEGAMTEDIDAEEGEMILNDNIENSEGMEGDGAMEGDMGFIDGNSGEFMFDEGMLMPPGMETMAEVKDPFLSSWPVVIGISAGVLMISVFLGVLMARRKIKKGIELYED